VLREAGKQLDTKSFSVEPVGISPVAPEVVFTLPAVDDELHKALLAYLLSAEGSQRAAELASSADRSLLVCLSLLAADQASAGESATPGGQPSVPLVPEVAGQPGLLLLVAGESGSAPTVHGTPAALCMIEHPEVRGLHYAFAPLPPGDYPIELSIAGERHLVPWPVLPGRLTAVVVVARPNMAQSYNLYLLPARNARSQLGAEELREFQPYTAARILESAEYAFARRFPLPTAEVRFADPLLLIMQAYTLLRSSSPDAALPAIRTLLRLFPTLSDVTALARLGSKSAFPSAALSEGSLLPELSALPLFREGIQALSAEELTRLGVSAPESVAWSGPFLRFARRA
jgi:hypothetical protein